MKSESTIYRIICPVLLKMSEFIPVMVVSADCRQYYLPEITSKMERYLYRVMPDTED